eukprot:m.531322 g.531322  ORF g.531322 m.531322 type:complete len:783 (-) comp22031_c0_seq2:642-2990(-)
MVDADTMMADEPTHAGGGSWTMPGQHTEHITIQLEPSGLGMQVQPLASGGVVVAKIFPGKSAHRDGRLRTGDVLLQINETDMTAINNREMTTVFRDAMTQPEISLVVARPNKRSTAIHQRDSLVSTASTARDGASQAGTHEDVVEHTHHMDSDEHPPRATRQGSGGSQNARMTDIRPREIRLPVTQTGLDIAITRGPKDARRNTTICVQWVNPTGNVGRDGRIKQRDVLLTIDGHSLLNVSTEEAIRLLSLARGPAEAEGTTAVTVPLHDGAALGIVLEGGFADDVDPASGGGGGVYTPIRVKEVVHGSAGYAAGVTPGCEVVSINGRSLDGVTLDRATTILSVAKLRSASAGVTLVLRTGSFVTLQYLPMSGDGGSQRRSPASLQHPDVSRASVHSRRRDSDGGNSDGGRSDSSVGSRSQRSGLARADDDGVTATHLAFDGVDPNVPSSGPLSVADADRLRDAYARAVADRDSLRGALLAERNKRAMVQNKLDLATAARDAARTVEHDYDEIVTLLEAEVAHLRAQLLADPDDRHRLLIDYRKRCASVCCVWVQAWVWVYVGVLVYVCVHAFVYGCVFACARACVRVCGCVCECVVYQVSVLHPHTGVALVPVCEIVAGCCRCVCCTCVCGPLCRTVCAGVRAGRCRARVPAQQGRGGQARCGRGHSRARQLHPHHQGQPAVQQPAPDPCRPESQRSPRWLAAGTPPGRAAASAGRGVGGGRRVHGCVDRRRRRRQAAHGRGRVAAARPRPPRVRALPGALHRHWRRRRWHGGRGTDGGDV